MRGVLALARILAAGTAQRPDDVAALNTGQPMAHDPTVFGGGRARIHVSVEPTSATA